MTAAELKQLLAEHSNPLQRLAEWLKIIKFLVVYEMRKIFNIEAQSLGIANSNKTSLAMYHMVHGWLPRPESLEGLAPSETAEGGRVEGDDVKTCLMAEMV